MIPDPDRNSVIRFPPACYNHFHRGLLPHIPAITMEDKLKDRVNSQPGLNSVVPFFFLNHPPEPRREAQATLGGYKPCAKPMITDDLLN